MNINRDNYEEYFLLYADDELTDSEKANVLMFVKNNKDLEEEFRMIHHTILKPDVNVKLDNKSFLLKNIASFINEKNYEEAFVLYHDNELNEKQKKQTEEFLSLHKELKNEFDLIGITRLAPAANIIFANKNVLYKKEKTEKVAPIIFWRMLAAAAFIGCMLWGIDIYIQKPSSLRKPVAHSIPVEKMPGNKNTITLQKSVNEEFAPTPDKNSSYKKTNDKTAFRKYPSQKNNNDALVKATIKKEIPVVKNKNSRSPEKANDENVASATEIKSISKKEITGMQKMSLANLAVPAEVIKSIDELTPETYKRTSSYNEDVHAKNDNYVFYDVTANKFKKTKVGGFLKKMKRVIVRTNPIGRLLSGEERQVASN